MWNRAAYPVVAAMVALLAAAPAAAADEEGCLFCHGLELRVAAPKIPDGRDLRVSDPAGAHDALFCSDCHVDARRAPHGAPPGPAQCIGECHGQTAAAKESHRRASFGGLVEPHRGLTAPAAPCHLCHRAGETVRGGVSIAGRCAGCHRAAADSEASGVHARLAGRAGTGACLGCHPAHPSGSGSAKATCGAPGCHATVTAGMKALVGHRTRTAASRIVGAALLIGLAGLGFLGGRRLSPGARKDGSAP